MKIGK